MHIVKVSDGKSMLLDDEVQGSRTMAVEQIPLLKLLTAWHESKLCHGGVDELQTL
jgi:hypothetical protein